jgi:hypothetical protein
MPPYHPIPYHPPPPLQLNPNAAPFIPAAQLPPHPYGQLYPPIPPPGHNFIPGFEPQIAQAHPPALNHDLVQPAAAQDPPPPPHEANQLPNEIRNAHDARGRGQIARACGHGRGCGGRGQGQGRGNGRGGVPVDAPNDAPEPENFALQRQEALATCTQCPNLDKRSQVGGA